jgi:hypothetical protein
MISLGFAIYLAIALLIWWDIERMLKNEQTRDELCAILRREPGPIPERLIPLMMILGPWLAALGWPYLAARSLYKAFRVRARYIRKRVSLGPRFPST